ncbi:hypothetical protein NDU88_001070 [Pleurodeles waltl]|uniref:Uncharacterized protein n=1 Tax=Pleurodeles waltl TaxID=8319 RepID=A0AAV7U9D4_PLEWA|nr:hypothetical protein NDU88_001070 [Pleurodeles waltl]
MPKANFRTSRPPGTAFLGHGTARLSMVASRTKNWPASAGVRGRSREPQGFRWTPTVGLRCCTPLRFRFGSELRHPTGVLHSQQAPLHFPVGCSQHADLTRFLTFNLRPPRCFATVGLLSTAGCPCRSHNSDALSRVFSVSCPLRRPGDWAVPVLPLKNGLCARTANDAFRDKLER